MRCSVRRTGLWRGMRKGSVRLVIVFSSRCGAAGAPGAGGTGNGSGSTRGENALGLRGSLGKSLRGGDLPVDRLRELLVQVLLDLPPLGHPAGLADPALHVGSEAAQPGVQL